jgi:CheY-like chemotaxis protein
MNKPRVLVVDDQQKSRIAMSGLIENLGAQVETAEDGYRAIEGAKRDPFDLAFIDIEMPGINGIQTLRELLKLRPEMVAAMVTGYGEAGLVKEALNEGAVAVLLKPFDAGEISHLVSGINWPTIRN